MSLASSDSLPSFEKQPIRALAPVPIISASLITADLLPVNIRLDVETSPTRLYILWVEWPCCKPSVASSMPVTTSVIILSANEVHETLFMTILSITPTHIETQTMKITTAAVFSLLVHFRSFCLPSASPVPPIVIKQNLNVTMLCLAYRIGMFLGVRRTHC